MNKIEEVLAKYGFLYIKKETAEKECEITKAREKTFRKLKIDNKMSQSELNTFKIIDTMNHIGEIKIGDVDLYYKLQNIPRKYNEVKPIVQDAFYIRSILYGHVGAYTEGRNTAQYELEVENFNGMLRVHIKNDLQKNPQRYGFNEKEIKLKEMFATEFSYTKEAERLDKLFSELVSNREMLPVAEMIREIKEVVEINGYDMRIFEQGEGLGVVEKFKNLFI